MSDPKTVCESSILKNFREAEPSSPSRTIQALTEAIKKAAESPEAKAACAGMDVTLSPCVVISKPHGILCGVEVKPKSNSR